ncbi:helix-turn-helix transcriptional regulator [Francisella philomiragia]|uniref:Prophage CP4-57 regulatory family protein n=1 Tax=Francisella philomiragia TaxID=28110 RepID=A0A0B6D3T9_9GAMM|nr:AlpA family phage regulatory protein [Francisella philomiragia]AJI52947.1 prophage CP4-57 regulatory family protein [Francisella philomiragia]MBY7734796.1 AlpA family phage regulatory protein [Francisella philomiragia]
MNMLRINQVIEKTGLSRSTIYRLVNSKEMPQPIKLTEKTTVWISTEIDSFLEKKIQESRG